MESVLLDLQANGATVACKRPGQDPGSCKLLDPRAAPYLTKEDCFVFIMTSFQAKLLQKFGMIVSSDGSHCVLTFNRVKLIMVLVASYGCEDIKEKGKFGKNWNRALKHR